MRRQTAAPAAWLAARHRHQSGNLRRVGVEQQGGFHPGQMGAQGGGIGQGGTADPSPWTRMDLDIFPFNVCCILTFNLKFSSSPALF